MINVADSVLKTVRTIVGLNSDNTEFDVELLTYTNAVIGNLEGTTTGLVITNENQKWDDLLDPTIKRYTEIRAILPLYISLSVKILFDPPPPSAAQHQARIVDELAWKIIESKDMESNIDV